MYSTHSSVTQLKPSTISECVQDAEEQRWAQGDVAELVLGSHDQTDVETQNLGSMLLGQSTSLKKIHGYFSQLESRKCCLHLACQRSTFNSMRFVPSSRTVDDGSAKSSEPTSEVKFLENKDLRAFKHAYLSAIYPVLAAPDPPSPMSPSPAIQDGSSASTFLRRRSYTSTIVASPSSTAFSASAPLSRPLTPYSLHDSGVEESDETSLIPMESICEQLQRAFRLSGTVFQQYEHLIVKTYSKKSSQKLLAEELAGQLAVLETNSHPFYSPEHFITQNGYDLWQKQERTHVSELLNKFWNSSLPFPRDSQDLIAELHSVHEDYHILLKKLLMYESQFRQGSDNLPAGAAYVPLSSASCRLLLEFGLRYGIGELYCKTLLLQCLTSEFSPAVGYLTFINCLVVTIHQMLPSNKTAVIMVKQEFEMLCSTLRVLKVQACKTLSQMKSLFPANKPAEGIELLLILLRSVLRLMAYLAPANLPQEKFDVCLKATVKSIFKPAYEMFKSVAQEDLNRRREGDLDPRLLNILIQDIREDVNDYKTNFESTFEKYFSISKMAATTFYQFLMKDVESLLQFDLQNGTLVEIDLRMLALVYRLNTLDSDWATHITTQEQTWRLSFLSSLTQWTTALRAHLQNLVLDAVAGDAYVNQNFDPPQPVLTYQTAVTPTDNRSISFSIVSISPSINSAFSSILSSVPSTPHPDCIHENAENQVLENPEAVDEVQVLDFGLTEYEMEQSGKNLMSSYDTRSLNQKNANDKPLYFSANRRFSLPVKLDETKSNHQFKINQEYSDSGICSKGTTQNQTDSTRSHADNHSPSLGPDETDSQKDTTPTQILTPGSSSSDIHEQDNNVCESGDEDFTFPPLKIVSQKSMNSDSPSDFSKPVFSLLKSNECNRPRLSVFPNRNHLLKTDAPHSMSSRASSVTPDLAENEYEVDGNIESGVLFPNPTDINQAVMPVSGSLVDIIIMLQRLCCFSNNLVNVMLTESLLITASRQSSFQVLRHVCSNSSDSDQSVVNQAGTFPLYERTLSTASTKSSTSSLIRHRLATNSDSDFLTASLSAQEGSTNLYQSVSQASVDESEISDLSPLNRHKIKLALHLRMLKAMCNVLVVYTSNMLCMDLCATPRAVAKRLIGPKLVEFIESQQVGGLIWGCRHQAEASYDCLFYFNRKTQLLSDRHEPVTQHMCTRINNVFACLHILDKYQNKLLKAFNIEEDGDTFFHAQHNVSQRTTERRNSTESEDYVYVSHHMQDDGLLEDSLSSDLSSSAEDMQRSWSYESKQIVDMTRQQIMGTLTGMYRLLAHKLNLFVKDGLHILVHQKHPNMTITQALAPVTSFLQKYLDSLSCWLYHDCFRRVLDNFWVLIVQGIESHADELRKSETAASMLAHSWMLTVSHLIKFMNNNGRGIKKELLLSQANDVIFRLQLYTLSTSHLITLFESLRDYYFEGDHLTLEENAARNPPAIIHRIHHELQSLHKSFSGAELVHWIMKNKDALPADLPIPMEHVTKESAVIISQILLDKQFIVGVESGCSTSSATPNPTAMGEPYPDVIIHSQGSSGISNRPEHSDSCSSDSTLENMQHEVHQSSLGEISSSTRRAPVLDQTYSSNTRTLNGHGYSVYAKRDEETQSLGDSSHIKTVKRIPVTNNNGNQARSLYSEDLQNDIYDNRNRRNTGSFNETSYFDDHDKRLTPFSSLTEVTFSNSSKKFVASSKMFYSIHQSMLHQAATNTSSSSIPTESDHNYHRLKFSKENLTLIEQCFTHKLSPITIATIIAGRKKSDSLAKNFVKQLPRTVSEKVSNLLDESTWNCKCS